ncbi:hypothetical protein EI42_05240 [Thermosporothrix hazakensis]|uniref:Uncharacterized protein n=1 Tax=Thermosporothrix hazakensis TaxID=644383 RepID=A0A326UC89_THEHA|nr:hypothetical protein EI42_05240 [Thermosporothrix hazakensis]
MSIHFGLFPLLCVIARAIIVPGMINDAAPSHFSLCKHVEQETPIQSGDE